MTSHFPPPLVCSFIVCNVLHRCSAIVADRRRDQASDAITDEMLENITVLGDADTCRVKLEQFRHNGADMPVVAFPHGSSPEAIRRTLKALAPRAVRVTPGVKP